jgi:hypothetical protein
VAPTRRRPKGRSHSRTHRVRSAIAPLSQAQADLLRITIYRMRAFRKTFGRMPTETEPLLFVEGLAAPEFAPDEMAVEQLKQAASACGVDFQLIRSFLED